VTIAPSRSLRYDKVDFSPAEISDRILGALAVYSRDARYLASLFPRDLVGQVVRTITDLESENYIFRNHYGEYNLVDPTKIEQKPEVPTLKDISLQVPLGVFRDLKRYAKSQGTSVEMEAGYLLSEIVRVYKAQSVIPTT
jgi:hypothetical protein